ncbi:MAG: hypothetical protein ACTSUO_03085, partial [Candidatus Thorarchaeota archaeon]
MRNSQQTYSEGDLAGRKAEIQAGLGTAGGVEYATIFTGYVSDRGCQRSVKSLTEDTVTVTLVDPSKTKGMRRKIDPMILVGYKICNPSAPATSIIHQLAYLLGLSDSDLTTRDAAISLEIDHTKDYLSIKENSVAWKELLILAEAYLMKIGFRYDGKLLMDSRFQASWSAQGSEWSFDYNSNRNIHAWSGSLQPVNCNKAYTKFTEYYQLDPQVIYKNVENYDGSTEKISIVVSAGDYWPGPEMGDKAQLHYADPTSGEEFPVGVNITTPTIGATGDGTDIECDGGTLTLVSFNGTNRLLKLSSSGYTNCVSGDIGKTVVGSTSGDSGTLLDYNNTLRLWWVQTTDDFDQAEDVTITSGTGAGTMLSGATTTQQNPDSSEIILKNDTGSNITITKFELRGTPLRAEKDIRVEHQDETITDDTEIVDKSVNGKYMTSDSQAKTVVDRWVDFGKTSRKIFTARVDWTPHIQPNAVVTFTPESGLSKICVVVSYTHSSRGSMRKAFTTVTLLEDTDATFSPTSDYIPAYRRYAAGNSERLTALISHRPTFDEVAHDGWDTGTGTTTPTTPTIAVCKGHFKAIHLEWDKQLNLTNFDRYEVQVSSDDTNWYSLEFDLSDWKDTLNADTDWDGEFLIHPVPNDVTDPEDPQGRTLYYRVRRVTKLGVTSSWSASVSATSKTVDSGDLAANSVYANNIRTGALNTIIAEISDHLEISSAHGLLSKSNYLGSDIIEASRLYIDEDELNIEKFAGVAKSGTDSSTRYTVGFDALSSTTFVVLLRYSTTLYLKVYKYDSTTNTWSGGTEVDITTQLSLTTDNKPGFVKRIDDTHFYYVGSKASTSCGGSSYYPAIAAVYSVSGTTLTKEATVDITDRQFTNTKTPNAVAVDQYTILFIEFGAVCSGGTLTNKASVNKLVWDGSTTITHTYNDSDYTGLISLGNAFGAGDTGSNYWFVSSETKLIIVDSSCNLQSSYTIPSTFTDENDVSQTITGVMGRWFSTDQKLLLYVNCHDATPSYYTHFCLYEPPGSGSTLDFLTSKQDYSLGSNSVHFISSFQMSDQGTLLTVRVSGTQYTLATVQSGYYQKDDGTYVLDDIYKSEITSGSIGSSDNIYAGYLSDSYFKVWTVYSNSEINYYIQYDMSWKQFVYIGIDANNVGYMKLGKLTALDSSGLSLYDDGGNIGLKVFDGGDVGM